MYFTTIETVKRNTLDTGQDSCNAGKERAIAEMEKENIVQDFTSLVKLLKSRVSVQTGKVLAVQGHSPKPRLADACY